MLNNLFRTCIVLLAFAALANACTFDTAGLQEISQNNVNNVNNVNNIQNPVCGNNLIETGETCDGTDLAGSTCLTLGYDSGQLACKVDCTAYVTTGCEGTGPVCGNNLIETGETCDGTDLAGQTCVTQGFDSGTLACAAGCLSFVLSDCEGTGPVCGNGIIEGLELCDGANLAGNTCAGLGFARGDLACDTDCLGFNTDGCTMCGNDLINGDEVCDGSNLAGNTCVGLSFAGGDLACETDCTGFNTEGCETQLCGNNNAEGTEVCDGTDLNGRTCASEGFFGGTLACAGGCNAFVTSGCNLCGNLLIDAPEACDGTNLNSQTCLTQGCRGTGTLLCNADCTFLLTGCWAFHDEDGDGVDDNCDNCPTYTPNTQTNADNDQLGNLCEKPAAPTALSTISVFETMTNFTSWSTLFGTWTPGIDQVAGVSAAGTEANYFHSLTLPANNYSVEVNYSFPADPTPGSNWSGVIFAWQAGTSTLNSAYECLFERDSKELQIWKYTTYNDYFWMERASVVITTSATNGQSRKVRGYVSGSTIRCEYSDASGASGTISYTDSYVPGSGFAGKTGYRLYNESANFTSFIYYLP